MAQSGKSGSAGAGIGKDGADKKVLVSRYVVKTDVKTTGDGKASADAPSPAKKAEIESARAQVKKLSSALAEAQRKSSPCSRLAPQR